MAAGTMQTENRGTPGTSLWEATSELIAAGQQVILDRVELLRSEITDDLQDVLWGGVFVAAAVAVASFGWMVVSAALVLLIARWVPLDGALALVGIPHVLAGVVLAMFAVRRFRQIDLVQSRWTEEAESHA